VDDGDWTAFRMGLAWDGGWGRLARLGPCLVKPPLDVVLSPAMQGQLRGAGRPGVGGNASFFISFVLSQLLQRGERGEGVEESRHRHPLWMFPTLLYNRDLIRPRSRGGDVPRNHHKDQNQSGS